MSLTSDFESFKRQVETCASKATYASENQARTGGHRALRDKGVNERLWPYSCPICGEWHLTKKESHVPAVTMTAPLELRRP